MLYLIVPLKGEIFYIKGAQNESSFTEAFLNRLRNLYPPADTSVLLLGARQLELTRTTKYSP